MSNYLVFGGQNVSYTRRDGSEVNHSYLYHFPLEFVASSTLKGSELLSLDIYGSDFTLSAFQFPSIVSLSKRLLPNRRGSSSSSRLVDVDFVRSYIAQKK